MPFQKGYQDAMPTNPGAEAAAKILEAAGYSKNGDYYEKDGVKASYSVTTSAPTRSSAPPPSSSFSR